MIYKANNKIKEIYLGNTKIKEVYIGNTCVFKNGKPVFHLIIPEFKVVANSSYPTTVYEVDVILNAENNYTFDYKQQYYTKSSNKITAKTYTRSISLNIDTLVFGTDTTKSISHLVIRRYTSTTFATDIYYSVGGLNNSLDSNGFTYTLTKIS